jgi:hypothetical protein
MTEDEVRAALQHFDGAGGMEQWIAQQLWDAAPDGWTVLPDLGGWRFRLVPLVGSIQVIATAPSGGQPAVWVVRGST